MNFWQFVWLMIWAMFFILYLMVLFQIVVDIFRDSDTSGWVKAAWVILLFIFPAITALVYLIVKGRGMAARRMAAYQQSRQATDDYIRSVSGGGGDPSSQIANAKSLLDSGAISAEEFEKLKAKALA